MSAPSDNGSCWSGEPVEILRRRRPCRRVVRPSDARSLDIVGESGSGKTTLARCILRAIDPDEGTVRFNSAGGWVELQDLSAKELIPLRREMQMIFQDPFASLNPRMTVREILEEPLVIHRVGDRRERLQQVLDMLDHVQLGHDSLTRYPHAFSGGQRQRIGIARALILRPNLVVCDESVSALEYPCRHRIINLLGDLQRETRVDVLLWPTTFRSCSNCDRVLVMHRGRVVESGASRPVANPREDYTRLPVPASRRGPGCPLRPPTAVRSVCSAGRPGGVRVSTRHDAWRRPWPMLLPAAATPGALLVADPDLPLPCWVLCRLHPSGAAAVGRCGPAEEDRGCSRRSGSRASWPAGCSRSRPWPSASPRRCSPCP